MIAFLIWAAIGVVFIGVGIYCMLSKKDAEVGFWANAKTLPCEDVRAYNKAVGKLWCVFGGVLILLGLPLLAGQNSALVIIPILGIMVEAIVTMAVYTTVIEKKQHLCNIPTKKKRGNME